MYDCCIIGGGLAGLSSAILLAEKGFSVALVEKKSYPFHKVCGEYISMEAYPFLKELGIPLDELNLPKINQLKISSPKGYFLEQDIYPGGFGISRFTLDNLLYQRAKSLGAHIFEGENVQDITKEGISYTITTSAKKIEAKSCIGSFGKRSNLDTQLQRFHKEEEKKTAKNYIAVKYHVKSNLPENRIELHNFKDGYCGISRVEEGTTCLCYLTTAQNLKDCGGSIERLEAEILSKNPFLKHYLEDFSKLYEAPLSISNIYFKNKKLIENGVFMTGDAAGLITPLCGNGMSMALHASAMLSGDLIDFLNGKKSFEEMEQNYTTSWKKEFNTRLKAGRTFQGLFGNTLTTDVVICGLSFSKTLTQTLVNLTNGRTFSKNEYQS